MEPKFYSIAIDGPAGAGKSTLAKALAARLGFLYVDTGAIYRTVGLFVARSGGDCGDKAQVLARLPEIRIAMTYGEDGLQHMLLNGEDVTKAMRLWSRPTRRSGRFCWTCSGSWPGPTTSSWTGGTSGPSSCRVPM